MGILATGIAPASSAALPANQTNAAGVRPDGGLTKQTTVASHVLSGAAAVATAASEGKADKKRGVSSGESRRVDASFSGEDSKEAKKGNKSKRAGSIDVEA